MDIFLIFYLLPPCPGQPDVLGDQLGYAVHQQNPEAVKTITERLRERGDLHKYVNEPDEEGHMPLHWAAKVCKWRMRMNIFTPLVLHFSSLLFGTDGSHFSSSVTHHH